jgi:hypothetical protein
VILIGDVNVRPGLDVVAELDVPVTDDVATTADEATITDLDHRVAEYLLAFGHAGGDRGVRTDDRVAPDSDPMLVEDGPLGENQAAASSERPKPTGWRIVRPDGGRDPGPTTLPVGLAVSSERPSAEPLT